MITRKSQLVQTMKAAITCVIILGTLSMIWPAIMLLMMGAFLLLYSCSSEEEFVVLSWTNVGNLSFIFASLRQPGLPTILL